MLYKDLLRAKNILMLPAEKGKSVTIKEIAKLFKEMSKEERENC